MLDISVSQIKKTALKITELPQTDDGTDLYQWARFISAEREEEFAVWAEKNEYIGEALNRLEVISQDEKMRMAYTARQKAIFDYNTQMEERFEDGIAKGRAEERRNLIEMMRAKGYSEHDINDLLN